MEKHAATDTDALLEIVIPETDAEAVAMPTPHLLQSEAELSKAMVENLAKAAGVRVALDNDGVAQLLSTKPSELPIEGIVIARAIPPRPARPVSIKWHGDASRPVFPGDVFGHLLPPVEARLGTTVGGKTIEPPKLSEEPDVTLATDSGIAFDEETSELMANRYGIPRLDQGLLSIVPLINITQDGLQALGTIYPKDFFGDLVSLTRIRDGLRSARIKVEIKVDDIKKALLEARQQDSPQENVLMAEGRCPVNGTDGRFERAFKDIASGTLLQDGRIDFMERGAVQSVLEGQVLGHVVPPSKGKAGVNLHGEPLLASDGLPFKLNMGEGVEQAEDGHTYRATTSGVVVFSQSKLTVTDLFTVDKDLDYSVGNLRMDKGSVQVNQNVLEGFSITAPGNIYIGQVVEGADISAGGDVTVRGGLAMGKKGRIKAGGNVTAKFALHATIVANGDVDMGAVTDCDITAEGKVICLREKGTIIGGIVRSSSGVEAKEFGSELGVATQIVLGLQVKQNEELQAERKSLKEQIAKIANVLGGGSPKEILMRTPESKRQAVAELIKALMQLRERLDAISEKIREEQMLARKSLQVTLKAQKAIYPGVSITIGGLTSHVKETLKASKIYYDPSAGRITVDN